MSATSDLVERLRRHYVKEPQPGGLFLAECGLNNSFGAQRRVDAIHVGFTGTSGKILRGHEVKVSRADWLHELEQPEKAEFWSSACHEWWVVTPVPSIVDVGELPHGWGHMVPDPRAKIRFKVVVPAARKGDDHQPPWLAMRSILARLDTLQRGDDHARRMELEQQVRERLAREYEQRRKDERRLTSSEESAIAFAAEVMEALGLDGSSRFPEYRAARAALKLAPSLQKLQTWNGLAAVARQAAELAAVLETADRQLREVVGELQ